MKDDEYTRPPNPYKLLGDACRLSERTIRSAFARKPITWQTACIIARHARIPVAGFRIKDDLRGCKKGKKDRDDFFKL